LGKCKPCQSGFDLQLPSYKITHLPNPEILLFSLRLIRGGIFI
jgi:hypothetical protein